MRVRLHLTGLGLVLLCALLYLWGLGSLPFYTKGEPREATVVWEIYTTGEWILPLRNGYFIPSKPPLFHWLGALLSLAWGELSELTIRLPSALLAILGVLLTYYTGVALWGVEAGLVAAVILSTSFEWVRAATTARVDMTLTVFMVMAFLFFLFLYRRHQVNHAQALLFFVLLGLATLAKGPVGVLLPGLTVGIFLTLRRDLGFLRQLHIGSGTVVLVLIAGSWYSLALWQGGEEFFTKQILKENVLRFFASGAAGAGHEHPFYYFVPNLFLGMAPWSFFLPPLMVFLYQRRRTWAADEFLYLIVWAATVFFFYSASSSKRSVYILPLYPAIALLLGVWWQELRQGKIVVPRGLSWLLRGSGYLGFVTLVLAVVIVLTQLLGYDALGVIRPFLHPKDQNNLPLFTGIVSAHLPAFLLWFGVVGPSALFLVQGLRRQHWRWVFSALAAFTVSTFLLVNTVFQPAVAAARTFQPFMARVVAHVGEAALFFYRAFDSGAVYYADRRIPFYDAAQLRPGESYFLLMWEEEWAKVASHNGTGLRAVDVSEGTGPKGNHRLVLVAVPAGASVPVEAEPAAEDDLPEEDTL
jgi:4-amino-4-deoxy-L-arabinose transferase-like glycosyltransferase